MGVPKIVVLGAVFTDIIFFQVPKLPDIDESVYAAGHVQILGGKGFNQAVAAAGLGANVSLCASIGNDAHGQIVLQQLKNSGLGTSMIKIVPEAATSVCCVFLDDQGHSRFLGSGHACRVGLTEEHVEMHRHTIEDADVLLTTFDYPSPILSKAIEIARQAGVFVIANPAPLPEPVQPDALNILKLTDLVVPNIREAKLLLGKGHQEQLSEPDILAQELCAKGMVRVCVTAGELGSVLIEQDKVIVQPAFHVAIENSVGASDQLCGALSYYWTTTTPPNALRSATASVALWLKRTNRRTMPIAHEVTEYLRGIPQSN